MRKNLVLTIISAFLFSALVTSCASSSLPKTGLFLTVTEPTDESTINTDKVMVGGRTIPDAVVSVIVNDEVNVVEVGEQGNFGITVALDEGPNIIEVHASDWEGNEVSTILTIIYTP